MNKTRLEAFSDGVIAIVITIMVLEMKAPEGLTRETTGPLIPKFLSYCLSFLGVAMYWVNHHHLLHAIKKVTPSIMWANIHLLFWLSLIPFATALMGENHFEKNTVALYAVLALFCGAAFSILQAAIVNAHKKEKVIANIIKPTGWKSLSSIILYTLAIPIALFLNPIISGWIFFIVAMMWLIPDKNIEKLVTENEK